MADDLRLTPEDLMALDLPSHIVEMLTSVAIPRWFDRFEIRSDSGSVHVKTRGSDAFVVLGSTDSGDLAVRLDDGSVWWLLAPHASGAPELRHPGDEQFINSDLNAFARCVDEWSALLADGAAHDLRRAISHVDPAALDPKNEGVWRDAILDLDAGL